MQTVKTGIFNELSDKMEILTNNVEVFDQQFKDFKQTQMNINQFQDALAEFQHIVEKHQTNCEENWQYWTTAEVISWLKRIENRHFGKGFKPMFGAIKKYKLCGEDLNKMNDMVLKNVLKITQEKDRKLLASHIARVAKDQMITEQVIISTVLIDKINNASRTSQSEPSENLNNGSDIDTPKEKGTGSVIQSNTETEPTKEPNLCVICYGEQADRICLPCGHLCLCKNCEDLVKESKRCAFCGHELKDIVKVYSVGA